MIKTSFKSVSTASGNPDRLFLLILTNPLVLFSVVTRLVRPGTAARDPLELMAGAQCKVLSVKCYRLPSQAVGRSRSGREGPSEESGSFIVSFQLFLFTVSFNFSF